MNVELVYADIVRACDFKRESIPFENYLLFHGDREDLEFITGEIFARYPSSEFALPDPYSGIVFGPNGVKKWGCSYLVERKALIHLLLLFDDLAK